MRPEPLELCESITTELFIGFEIWVCATTPTNIELRCYRKLYAISPKIKFREFRQVEGGLVPVCPACGRQNSGRLEINDLAALPPIVLL
jgi:hypothetical protein